MVRSRSLRIGGDMVPLRWHDLRLDRSMKGMDMVRRGGKCSHSSIPIYPKHVGCCVPDFNSILQLKSFNDTDHN